MAFWFFKKREEGKIIDNKLYNIQKGLQQSFLNVKKDIDSLSHKTNESHNLHNNHKSKLEEHEQKLKDIDKKLQKIILMLSQQEKPKLEQEELIENIEIPQKDNLIISLTTTDKKLLATVYHLQKQLNGSPISFKSLASMAYAGQDYIKIRSTISQYLNTLYKFGLIEKKRHGREAYIYLTDLGLGMIKDSIKQENVTKKKKEKQFKSQ